MCSGVQAQIDDEFLDLFDPNKENDTGVKQIKAKISQLEQAVETGNKLKELDALVAITEQISKRTEVNLLQR